MKKTKSIFLASGIITFILVAANVVVSASYSTAGETLRDLAAQKIALQEANRDLNQQLLNHSSLTRLQQRATDLGFTRPDKVITIRPSRRPVALNSQ